MRDGEDDLSFVEDVEAMLDGPLAVDPNERLLAELGRLTAAVSMLAHEIKGLVEAREGDG